MPRPWTRASTAKQPPRREASSATSPSDRLDPILDRMTEGVLVLGADMRPTLANRAARKLLGFHQDELPYRLPSEELIALAIQARDEGIEKEATLRLFFPGDFSLAAHAAPLGDGETLITLRDVTQELLAQRIRKEFVAHASHELKSPVASLQALAEAVHQALADDPTAARRFADRLVTESDRLGRLVNDLLDLSRLEDPAVQPFDTVDLAELTRHEMTQVEDAAGRKRIELSGRSSEQVWVRGDEQQLRLLVRNLLENAIRYTQEDGHVKVEVGSTSSEASLTVADDGIGIPREAQARIFERFYRIDRARSRDRGGTGLGLAIVKHVAELHGGRVDLESELGEGSTFTASFPLLTERVRSIAG